jgi:hypothetical protein
LPATRQVLFSNDQRALDNGTSDRYAWQFEFASNIAWSPLWVAISISPNKAREPLMSQIVIACPECRKQLKAEEAAPLGKKTRCPYCKAIFAAQPAAPSTSVAAVQESLPTKKPDAGRPTKGDPRSNRDASAKPQPSKVPLLVGIAVAGFLMVGLVVCVSGIVFSKLWLPEGMNQQQALVNVKNAPVPAPVPHRVHWVHSKGSFTNTKDTEWDEKVDEEVRYHFQEADRTDDYVELKRSPPEVTVRLYRDRCVITVNNNPFPGYQGAWEQPKGIDAVKPKIDAPDGDGRSP